MSEFWRYAETGLRYVLDIKAYSCILFLVALLVPYVLKDWKRILLLLPVFTIGHFLTMVLSVFNVMAIKPGLVIFLVLATILATAAFHLFTAGKSGKGDNINATGFIVLFFGAVHGLKFAAFFKSFSGGNPSGKFIPLLEFETGIIAAQIVVAIAVLLLAFLFQNFLRFSKRDFTLVFSAFVIGVVLPMIIKNNIWN